MEQYQLAPTKTNLIKLRDDLKFAHLGYELLDQKRNILIVELLALVDQAVDFENRISEALKKAYSTLQEAVLRIGKIKVQQITTAVNIDVDIRIGIRRVMGVTLPVVDTDFRERAPYFSPTGTTYWIDSSLDSFKSVLKLMGKMAELKISVLRLASEVRKMIRKVNALEKIAIPEMRDTVSYIENRLEENERDMFVLMKLVKKRLEEKRVHIKTEKNSG
ncbi:MAG TPA: V-type ATP synthase subunit D [Spirochaetota bacterium]|nr:V-type ATP synthase subunit D [Spirochaetota bacterium]